MVAMPLVCNFRTIEKQLLGYNAKARQGSPDSEDMLLHSFITFDHANLSAVE